MESCIKILSGLLTPTIGLIVAHIAWQQHKTNQNRLKIELFDRRFKVYEGISEFLKCVGLTGYIEREGLANFYQTAMAVNFLFKDEVVTFINKMVHDFADQEKGASPQRKEDNIKLASTYFKAIKEQFQSSINLNDL